MPWQQALAIVRNAMDLVKVEKDGIIFIDAKDAAKAKKIGLESEVGCGLAAEEG